MDKKNLKRTVASIFAATTMAFTVIAPTMFDSVPINNVEISASAASISMSASEYQNGLHIYNYLKSNTSWTDSAICGVMAHLYAESRFISTAVNPNSGAYGVAQWLGVRLTNLKKCSYYSSIDVQLNFMLNELKDTRSFAVANSAIANARNNTASETYNVAYNFRRNFGWSPIPNPILNPSQEENCKTVASTAKDFFNTYVTKSGNNSGGSSGGSSYSVNYVKSFAKGTVLYTDAGSGKISMTLSAAGTYTIVEEKTVNDVKYGKFKSGAGWAALSAVTITERDVNYTKSFPKGTVLYKDAGSGEVSQTLTAAGTFTIVKEKTVSGVTYGKFKSGAGWAVLSGTIIIDPDKPANTGKITKADIDEVCSKYNYASGQFWTATSGTRFLSSCKSAAPSSMCNGDKTSYVSYSYYGASQCYVFADYVMANVASNKKGSTVELPSGQFSWAVGSVHNGFKKYSAENCGGLKVGDIIRGYGNNGLSDQHSAIVYDIDKSGNITFLEVWGSSGQISFSEHFGGWSRSPRTYEGLKNNWGINYVIRYEG